MHPKPRSLYTGLKNVPLPPDPMLGEPILMGGTTVLGWTLSFLPLILAFGLFIVLSISIR